jgi:hypothetical protein
MDQAILDELTAPGYAGLEMGFRQIDGGDYFAATYCRFPYAKGKMVDWWFGTFLMDTGSYQIWSPDHISFRWDDKKRPGTIIGATHISEEYLGPERIPMEISFFDPADIFDTAKFAETDISYVLVAENHTHEGELISMFLHVVRDTYFGCEMRNRFWVPNSTDRSAADLVSHNAREMGSLAEILPSLYQKSL